MVYCFFSRKMVRKIRRSRGKHSDRILWMKQGAVFGAALRFSQAGTAPRRENRPSARGTRSAFCKRAAIRAAYLGNGNPEQRSNFHKGASAARRENWLSARGKHSDRILWMKQGAVFGAALRFSQAAHRGRAAKIG